MSTVRLGGYELLEEIGRGGMGVVYRARQPALHRTVALKVLPGHLAQDEAFVERFLREARAAARLEHPNIVSVYDVGEADDTYFFVMQLLPGESLAELLLALERLEPRQVASLGIQVADALGYAHREGILHRDIKPGNLLIDRNGRCVLTDFGIALAATDTRLTQTGASLGSPRYMAPEVLQGHAVDVRSDLYALGIVLFEALTGKAPYEGDSAMAIAYQHVAEHLPRVRDLVPGAPEELDRIVARLMAKSPDERHQSADEVAAELLAFTGGVVEALPSAAAGGGVVSRTPVAPTTPIGTRATVATPVPGRAPRPRVRVPATAILVVLAAAVAIYLGISRPWRQPSTDRPAAAETSRPPTDEGAAAAPSGDDSTTPPPPPSRPTLSVDSDPPGLAILVDGVDRGLTTPASVEIEAEEGEEVEIALASAGAVVATRRIRVAADMPDSWRPVVAVERFTITSQPAGAAIYLSGERLDATTPVEVDLASGRDYRLRLELAGYDPAGMDLALDRLPEELRQSGQLHFPLTPTTPPGFLTARSTYAATVRVDGRDAASGQRIELPPGTHQVEVSAPSVYYAGRHTVEIRSEEEAVLELPAAVSVAVAATPSHCRVKIDGREVDYVPFNVDLTVGTHRFDFEWDTLQTSRSIEQRITPDTRRVFAAAGDPEG